MSADRVNLTLAEVAALSHKALLASNISEPNARSVTTSIVAAEAEGIHSHGLLRLPTYCEHAKCGKVNGRAEPGIRRSAAGALLVDAQEGFAHPAIDAGLERLIPLARENGIAALAVTNSYNCGVVGFHVERIADRGLVALGYVNSPAAIAPWGGKKPLFGTNPVAFAAPRKNAPPVVIDQSSSVVARGEVMVHAQQGKPIPTGWALDKDGQPTNDPQAALAGSMLPAGGHKGAGIALLVDIMAAGMTGANFSFNAASFADNNGGPPRTGQFFIALDPSVFVGAAFSERLETLFTAILNQPGTRLPGDKRNANRARTARDGISIKRALYDDIVRRTQGG
ncbi:MAG: sulfolactate dehydrogenase [Betaproteobacteria bacterium RIFCSPLOWO2_12_FULL_62_58]|nr:MAG: sulfolactate dehydrogenase [Betaproteobacteria bacterium RIFCSPLOWO2_12_FULL_62_58]